MKLYDNKESTPLRFYKFYRNVWIPLGILSGLYTTAAFIISTVSKPYDVAFLFTGIRYVLFLALDIIILIGLVKWKRYTVTFVLISLIIYVLGSIYYVAASPMAKPYLEVILIITLLVFGFPEFMIYVYFYKRKKLLDGIPYNIPKQVTHQMPLQEYYAQDYSDAPEEHDNQEHCPCGYPVLREYTACPDCGRKYTE